MTDRSSDVIVHWGVSPRKIVVKHTASPNDEFVAQDIIDTLSALQAEIDGLDDPRLSDNSGKEVLGGGVQVGLTTRLFDTQIGFQQPPASISDGTITTQDTNGQTLIDSAATFQTDNVSPGDCVINFTDMSYTTVLRVDSQIQIYCIDPLTDGTDNQFDVGDSYKIVPVKQCDISGGNVIAIDELEAELSPVFPTAFTQVIRAASTSATLVAGTGGATAEEVADAVWDETLVDHLGVGSTGAKLNEGATVDESTIADAVWNEPLADHLDAGSTGAKLNEGATVDAAEIANAVWDEVLADHLIAGTTGAKLNEGATVDADEIADAVWDELLADHTIEGSAGEYLYTAGRMAPDGGWMSTATLSEIKMVRDKLQAAGEMVVETIINEEAVASTSTTVFTMWKTIQNVTGVWLATDYDHTGTNYYTGDNGTYDTYTGKITLHTALASDNESVLISYTYGKGLTDDAITSEIVAAKLYVKEYTRRTFSWSAAFDDPPDEEAQLGMYAVAALAAKNLLASLSNSDIVQMGFRFRVGDFEVDPMTSGGFHVQALIDQLDGEVKRWLSILGRGMHVSARTSILYGRDARGYKRKGDTRRSDIY